MNYLPGNDFRLWTIDNEGRICYVNDEIKQIPVSPVDYATDIAISDNGVIWALTNIPDPDGGGAKIAWLGSDKKWNSIETRDPGAFTISGGPEDQCVFVTSEGIVYAIDTRGKSSVIYNDNPVLGIDYGGGNIWGVLSDKAGEIPQLHYGAFTTSIKWNEFKGVQSPTSLSANMKGECVGIEKFDPYLYVYPDTSNLFGSGISDKAMQISYKSKPFLVSNEPTSKGNLIYYWLDGEGGVWLKTDLYANRVLSTYFYKERQDLAL